MNQIGIETEKENTVKIFNGKFAGLQITLNLWKTDFAMKITLLNTSILTTYGTFEFQPILLSEARDLVKSHEVVSAIGHAATADVLSDLLGIKVTPNRLEFSQNVGETALVFKLKSRIPEGKVLNRAEIETVGYEFGILRRLK